jgi:hypothetical protein
LSVDFPQGRQDPVARLWQELEPWFRQELDDEAVWKRDVLGILPAHGLSLIDLQPAELDRVWHLIADRMDPPVTSVEWPEWLRSVPAELSSEGAFAAASRRYMPLIFEAESIVVAELRLPPFQVEIYRNQLGLFWTLGEDTGWEPEHVAALAVLIGDLRKLLPRARMTFDRQPEMFWHAIDAYLASRGSWEEPPAPHD